MCYLGGGQTVWVMGESRLERWRPNVLDRSFGVSLRLTQRNLEIQWSSPGPDYEKTAHDLVKWDGFAKRSKRYFRKPSPFH